MITKLKLRSLLMYFANFSFNAKQVEVINQQFRTAILDYGSETPDNRASVDRIEIGKVRVNNRLCSGLKVKGKNILLSEIMNEVESMPMPIQIQEQFTELTQEEWEAATRIMTLILLSLEEDN
jgi:hypothetical protein